MLLRLIAIIKFSFALSFVFWITLGIENFSSNLIICPNISSNKSTLKLINLMTLSNIETSSTSLLLRKNIWDRYTG